MLQNLNVFLVFNDHIYYLIMSHTSPTVTPTTTDLGLINIILVNQIYTSITSSSECTGLNKYETELSLHQLHNYTKVNTGYKSCCLYQT